MKFKIALISGDSTKGFFPICQFVNSQKRAQRPRPFTWGSSPWVRQLTPSTIESGTDLRVTGFWEAGKLALSEVLPIPGLILGKKTAK